MYSRLIYTTLLYRVQSGDDDGGISDGIKSRWVSGKWQDAVYFIDCAFFAHGLWKSPFYLMAYLPRASPLYYLVPTYA